MNSIIFVTLGAALLVAVSASPQGFPYAANYGFISGGPGGIAQVDVAQNPHTYSYRVNENGPFHYKHVEQSGANHHYAPIVPVAVPVAPHHGHGGFGHGPYFF